MSNPRYTDECKIEAVRQITDRGLKVTDIAQRLGVTTMWTYNHDRPNMALGEITPKHRIAMAA